ncbi:MAG: hypothetical protein R3D25_22250 [Geminicoccaceae bacterium]
MPGRSPLPPTPCAPLTVPDELGLVCRIDRTGTGDVLVVEPAGGTFQALSRLTLRELDPGLDGPAWSEPEAWLEQQMVVDVGALSAALDEVGGDPDSPFGSEMIKNGIAMLVDGLKELSRLPLAACGGAATDEEIDCRFGIEPFLLFMRVSLVARDEARFAFNIRTFNEQRLRHFTAIANSFDPASPAP